MSLMIEVKGKGSGFTWFRKEKIGAIIEKKKLNLVLAGWGNLFP